MAKIKHDKSAEIFVNLVNSALDFLETSLKEVEKKPKYSVIHFCSGVEIFLKARLLLDNWELIVENKKPSHNLNSLQQGHLKTVGLEDAIDRLERIVKTPISKATEECFKNLADHRNKYIHFFQKGDKKAVFKIVGEQYRGWHHLHSLLTREWKQQFKSYMDQINKVDDLIRKNRKFLQEVFILIAGNLEAEALTGINVFKCHICDFKAAKGVDSENRILCEVCKDQSDALRVLCNHCGIENHFYLDNIAELLNEKCWKCDSHFEFQLEEILPLFIDEMGLGQIIEDLRSEKSPREIIEALLKHIETDDVIKNVREVLGLEDVIEGFSEIYEQDQNTPAHCLDCEGEDEDQPTVLHINGKYLCLNCDEVHSIFSHCDSCQRDLAGEDRAIYENEGCRFCDEVAYDHIDDEEDFDS